MEKLYVKAVLAAYEFIPREEYFEVLHERYYNDSGNKILFELECLNGIWEHIHYLDERKLNFRTVTTHILRHLNCVLKEATDVEDFPNKTYLLWQGFSEHMEQGEIPWALLYIGDVFDYLPQENAEAEFIKEFNKILCEFGIEPERECNEAPSERTSKLKMQMKKDGAFCPSF